MKVKLLEIAFVLLIFAIIGVGISLQKVSAEEKEEQEQKTASSYVSVSSRKVDTSEIQEVTLPNIYDLACVEKVEEKEVVKAWDDIPLDYDEQVALWDKCEELGISYWFMLALCESESSFRSKAVGDNGKSVGYMQINKCNWDRMQKQYGLDVNDPIDNLFCGCYMIAELMNKYDTMTEVIMGYKCGESRMKKLLKEGKVLKSVEKVTNRAIEFENAHREED